MTTRVLGNYAVRRAGWIAALSIAAVAGSLLFACTTPFAALATFAALYMQRRDAFMVTGITWLANQLVGFGFLHYPHTWTTAAWGIAIGVSALVATALAAGINSVLRPYGWLATVPAASRQRSRVVRSPSTWRQPYFLRAPAPLAWRWSFISSRSTQSRSAGSSFWNMPPRA